jgi:hypothetical protein
MSYVVSTLRNNEFTLGPMAHATLMYMKWQGKLTCAFSCPCYLTYWGSTVLYTISDNEMMKEMS